MKRVGLIADNSKEYVSSLIKIWKDGSSAVLIDWRIPFNKAVGLLKKSGVNDCFIDKNIYEKNRDKLPGDIRFTCIQRDSSMPEQIPKALYNEFSVNYSKDEAVIFFSSGTTGEAKGVILSHFAINSNADSIIEYMQLQKTDKIYVVRTLAHASTLVGELLVGLKADIPVILSPTVVSPVFSLDNIQKCQATILCINPTLLNLYIKAAQIKNLSLKSLHSIYSAGASLKEDIKKSAKAVFISSKIMNSYGLTEAGPRVTAQCPDNYDSLGSAGKPVNGVELAIVNENGEKLRENEKGLIHVNTISKFSGYVSGTCERESLYNGWLNTGDVGYVDKHGNLYVVGRHDDMIIQGAHNIYPEDIEKSIRKHPYIKECTVFGIENDMYGQRIICYFVSDNPKIVSVEIRDFCSGELAAYEIPQEFIPVDTLPKTEGGKISRKLARELYSSSSINSLRGSRG